MWYGIVLAGGSGSRMQAGKNKVLLSLKGKAVLSRSVEALRPFCRQIVVVLRPEDETAIRETFAADGIPVETLLFAYGGETRQDSVFKGLCAIPADCAYVMIHDGARCLVDGDTIRNVMTSVEACGTGVAAIPVKDTIKMVDVSSCVTQTPQRSNLRAVQTPQGFTIDLIRRAHQYAQETGFQGTDDAALVEHLGESVRLVAGNEKNLKLTTPEDLTMAQSFLSSQPSFRIGQGYDVHRLVEDRPLILCGVTIPHTVGLLGHSDADVALHALMDAMLGAMGLGDIGKHFPDTDPQYKGISSTKLLSHVVELLAAQGATVSNCDVTIVAQKPKLLPYIPQMRENVAKCLGIPLTFVNIKATTTERLGFEGE